jgi:hypothetical protein
MPVYQMSAPDIGFGFAWEPESQRLYIVHAADGAPHEQIAAGVATPQIAQLLVNMWCRGYRSRAREITRKPGAPHHHMFAETGSVGMALNGNPEIAAKEGGE